MDKEIKYLSGRLGCLRAVFEIKKKCFKELRAYLAPNTGSFEEDDNRSKEKDQFHKLNINTMPYKYNITLAAMLGTNFTSSSIRWFKMGQRNEKPTRDERRYFQETENLMYDVFEDSNLHPTLNNVYLESQTYGTGAGYKVKDSKNVMRFRPLTIGEYFIEENIDGVVDVLYRYMDVDVRRLEQLFGYEKLPNKYKMLYKAGKFDSPVRVWHAIEPNMEFLEAWDNPFNKPYTSTYFIENERDGILEQKGTSFFPYFVARWDKFGNDPYGVGIGITALGDIKMLQSYERDMAKASKKKIAPPLRIDPSLKKSKVDSGSGKPTYTSMKDGVTPLFMVNYDVREARENIAAIQDRVFKYFYNDVFFAMLNTDKTMSATEAAARNSEKMQMLGAIVNRWQKDFLEPIIETTYIALGEKGKLPETPDSLVGINVDIDYHGLTFQSIDLADLANVERFNVYAANIEAISPGALDYVDGDFMLKYGGSKMDIPVDAIRSQDQVDLMREKRAEAQEQIARKEQAETFEKTAGGAEKLSKAGMTGDNALAKMLEAA